MAGLIANCQELVTQFIKRKSKDSYKEDQEASPAAPQGSDGTVFGNGQSRGNDELKNRKVLMSTEL